LVTGRAQFRQDHKIGFHGVEGGGNAIEIVIHLPEYRIILVIPYPHNNRSVQNGW
jgi:hypothetical protein